MIKRDMINNISEKTGYSKEETRVIVEAVFNEISNALLNGESVQIRGFGVFERKKSERRVGRDIGNNKAIEIPKRYVPVFRPYDNLKKLVNINNIGGLCSLQKKSIVFSSLSQ